MDEIVQTATGKKKDYIKGIKRSIEKMDSSLGDKILAAAQDCQEIMQPFVCREYQTKDFDEIVKVATRLNALRNDIAHGDLDFNLASMRNNVGRDFKGRS